MLSGLTQGLSIPPRSARTVGSGSGTMLSIQYGPAAIVVQVARPHARHRPTTVLASRRLLAMHTPESLMNPTDLQTTSVADAYLALLASRGVDYLFANAGTDFAPLIEALAKAQAGKSKGEHPQPFLVPHENVAVAMAHGYYMAPGPGEA